MSSDGSTLLGVVVLARHGDRQGFYQDLATYNASDTAITPLGETQEFQLGSLLNSLYLNESSPSFIKGIASSSQLFNGTQVKGLWPPTSSSVIQLANGTNVTSPLNGYQYVPIESVESNEDVSLEGFTSCPNLDQHTLAFYSSRAFAQKAAEVNAFLTSLVPILDGRLVALQNIIFDFMNVQSIHNATFAASLPTGALAQARDLANWHEYNVFSDTSLNGIGNIAFRTMIPSVATAMQRIANSSDPLKLHYSAISYKPFLSLFNMTGVNANGALPPAIVNYAAPVVFEVRQPATPRGADRAPPVQERDGRRGARRAPMTLPAFSGTDVPLSTFLGALEPAAVNTTMDWCYACGQSSLRGARARRGVPACGGVDRGGRGGRGVGDGLRVLAFMGYVKFQLPNRRRRTSEAGSSTDSITKESV
ncbi:phosphoglycerate mutase-like protein [Epithele typhae]|uniref:phosphoglycerate mutase-like protein n=1 Tax=Epithele typhae TaxID=378194 RepID=UPI00200828D0|nr:phosphoglycerate mutase-like protein [Epithele typhae]KAH9924627.1 phosphoglycerate mutase-like protein [Epithele typhae]